MLLKLKSSTSTHHDVTTTITTTTTIGIAIVCLALAVDASTPPMKMKKSGRKNVTMENIARDPTTQINLEIVVVFVDDSLRFPPFFPAIYDDLVVCGETVLSFETS